MSMSLNKVMLIGRMTRDPELRYTAQGTPVCSFSVATNRVWKDNSGQRQEDTEFTRCVAWAKRAEICAQILKKGRQVYVDGRLQTREWEGNDGVKRKSTEIVVANMIALGAAGGLPPSGEAAEPAREDYPAGDDAEALAEGRKKSGGKGKAAAKKEEKSETAPESQAGESDAEVPSEDIPF